MLLNYTAMQSHTLHDEVDARGVHGPTEALKPDPFFLQMANIFVYDAKRKTHRGISLGGALASRDDGAPVCLINPALLSKEAQALIEWLNSDIRLSSASGHDVQGGGSALMCHLTLEFQGAGAFEGKTKRVAHTFYRCGWITTPLLLGRTCVENKKFDRRGDMANGLQFFGDFPTKFVPAPTTSLLGGVPVFCTRAMTLPARTAGVLHVASDRLETAQGGPRAATIGLKVFNIALSWAGPATPQTILLSGLPCEIQVVNCSDEEKVYAVGDVVDTAVLVGTNAANDPASKIGADAGNDAFAVGGLPQEYLVNLLVITLDTGGDSGQCTSGPVRDSERRRDYVRSPEPNLTDHLYRRRRARSSAPSGEGPGQHGDDRYAKRG